MGDDFELWWDEDELRADLDDSLRRQESRRAWSSLRHLLIVALVSALGICLHYAALGVGAWALLRVIAHAH